MTSLKNCFLISLLILLAFFNIASTTQNNEEVEDKVKVRTLDPLNIENPTQNLKVKAAFQGITPQALDIGLNKALLVGEVVEVLELPNGFTRVKIHWNNIGILDSTSPDEIEPITTPLVSQFRTKDKTIKSETILIAKGNFDNLTQKFLTLKELADKTGLPENPAIQEGQKNQEETDFSPRSANTASNSPTTPITNDGDFNTNLISTSFEDCSYRISSTDSTVYEQHRTIETNNDGSIANQGKCVDTGINHKAKKIYGGDCLNTIDLENKKVYLQNKELATIEDEEIEVNSCNNDFTKSFAILADSASCGYRHDFNNNKSIKQEILFYDDKGTRNDITVCQDSTKAYSHYLTTNTCGRIIDKENNLVFINKRTAFTLDNNTIEFANDCRPITGDTGKTILERYCSVKYEHDFQAGQSYYKTRSFYVDEFGVDQYISDCTRSAKASFPHIYETDNCNVTNDDVKLQTIFNSKTQIDTPEDGIIELAPCQKYGNPVLYVPQTGVSKSQTILTTSNFVVPGGVKSVDVTIWAAGGGGKGGGRNGQTLISGTGGSRGARILNRTIPSLTPGEIIPVTIGTGGLGGAGDRNFPGKPGLKGGDSTFGAYLSVIGGAGSTSPNGALGEPGYNPTSQPTPIATRAPANSGAGGGGGAPADTTGGFIKPGGSGGSGGDGGAIITWNPVKYLRADGSIYDPN